jgi:hypothetical protein
MMSPETMFLAVPLVVYLALAALPAGRPALWGIALAVVLAILAAMLGMSESNSGMLAVLGLFSGSAIAMAAMVQILRRGLGEGRAVWTYPALVLAGMVAGGAVVFQMMGT